MKKYITTCPNCSDSRRKQETKCCSVLEFESGLSLKCFHCGYKEFVRDKGLVRLDIASSEEVSNYNLITIPEGVYPFEDKEVIWHKYYLGEELKMYIGRKGTGDNKWIRPFTLSDDGWMSVTHPGKFLYRSECLSKDSRPVIVVEGEKAADKASKIFKKGDVVSWRSGVNNIDQADWSLINGRTVYLWPDNDLVGKEAMMKISALLPKSKVFLVDVSSLPEKADLGDDIDIEIIKDLYANATVIETDFIKGEMRASDMRSLHQTDFVYTKFGWDFMDRYVQLPPSGVVVVSGRVNHGKTAFMINLALNVAMKTNKTVLYLSLEFPIEELNLRMVKTLSGAAHSLSGAEDDFIYNKMIRDLEGEHVNKYFELISTRKLRVADSNISPTELLDFMDRSYATGKELVLFVDYLQIIPTDDSKFNKARYEKLKDMIEAIRFKANKNKQVVVGGSQLTAGDTPFNDSVRESKDLENTAALHLKVWNKAKAREKNITVKRGKEEVELYAEVPGQFVVHVEKSRQNNANGRSFGFNFTNGCKLIPAFDESQNTEF